MKKILFGIIAVMAVIIGVKVIFDNDLANFNPDGKKADNSGVLIDTNKVSLNQNNARLLINAYRISSGGRSVKFNKTLRQAALIYAESLAKNRSLENDSRYIDRDGNGYISRLRKLGYNPKYVVQLNGIGQESFHRVLKQWIKHSPSKKKLNNPYLRDIGIVLHKDPKSFYKTYWVIVMAVEDKIS